MGSELAVVVVEVLVAVPEALVVALAAPRRRLELRIVSADFVPQPLLVQLAWLRKQLLALALALALAPVSFAFPPQLSFPHHLSVASLRLRL